MNDNDRARILEEFPDYDGIDALPDYAALGLVCMAWHNDTCPRFDTPPKSEDDYSGWSLFIDYTDPAKREAGGGRFTIGWVYPCGGYGEDSYSGDDWAEVVRVVNGPVPA